MAWHLFVGYWFVHAAVGSLLFLGAGYLAVRFSRQPIRRLRLIELTLLGCLIVPWLALVPGLPHWKVGGWTLLPEPHPETPAPRPPAVLANSAPPEGDLAVGMPARQARNQKDEITPIQSSPAPRPATAPTVPLLPAAREARAAALSWSRLLLLVVALYVLGVAVLALRWGVGLGKLMRLYRTASAPPAEVLELFRHIAGSASANVQLLVSERLEVPLTFGGWRPVILLPARLCRGGDEASLRYCLAHEWSHVEQRDIRTWNLAALGQILFFYQPLYWWLRRQLRLCQDFLADARAAEQAPAAEDYATFLVGLARRRQGALALPALGVSDRRSNLYRRVIMLVQNRDTLERRCPRLWNWTASLGALAILAGVAGLRLQADVAKPQAQPAAKTAKEADQPKELKYTGLVVEKGTGKPLQGATVTVRRSLYGDPRFLGEKIVQETKHPTDAQGKYSFTIPPEQVAERYLYIELDVEHTTHAPQAGFGYALSMILKNEKLGGRPFFERVELWPGDAVTGQVQTPDGKPAAGVKVLAYSRPDTNDFTVYGSFATVHTDAKGSFRLVAVKNGRAAFWILPEKFALSAHIVKKPGDQGLFVLQHGIRLKGKLLDAKGKPVAGVWVNANRTRSDEISNVGVGDSMNRSALTNKKGEFEMNPLPPGDYEIKPDRYSHDSSREGRQPHHLLPAVFLAQKVTLKEGEQPDPLEVQAVPHVVIEAQVYDSKGKKSRGHEFHVFGQLDKKHWFGMAKKDAEGKITALVPHGLEQTRVDLMTNEHGVLRWRKQPGDALHNSRQVDLGTVHEDVKSIQIIHYVAPILVIKVKAKDGKKLKGAAVTATYPKGKAQYQGRLILRKGLQSDVSFEEQEDGRFRSSQLFPDEDVTVTGQAEGYAPASTKVKLPEGAQKEVEIVLDKK